MSTRRGPTPNRITLYEHESLYSLLQRLTRRHDCDRMQDLCILIGLDDHNCRNARVSDTTLRQLAQRTGLLEADLMKRQVCSHGEGSAIASNVLSTTFSPRKILKYGPVCPICLAEDSSRQSELREPSTYRRWFWDLNYLAVCATHGASLIVNCPHCSQRLSWKNLDPRYCSCGADLTGAASQDGEACVSELQKHLARQTLGVGDPAGGFAAKLPPKELHELALRMAWELNPDKSPPADALAARASDPYQDRAFHALIRWPTGARAVLRDMRSSDQESGTRIISAYGRFYFWLGRRNPDLYKPLVDLFESDYKQFRTGQSDVRLFKRQEEPDKKARIRFNASQLELSDLHYVKIAEEMLKRAGAACEQVDFSDDELFQKVREFLLDHVDKDFVTAKITTTERNINNLCEAGLLKPLLPGSYFRPFFQREGAIRIAGAIDAVPKGRVWNDDGVTSLGEFCKYHKISMIIVLKRLLCGTIKAVGHDDRPDRLPGLLFVDRDLRHNLDLFGWR